MGLEITVDFLFLYGNWESKITNAHYIQQIEWMFEVHKASVYNNFKVTMFMRHILPMLLLLFYLRVNTYIYKILCASPLPLSNHYSYQVLVFLALHDIFLLCCLIYLLYIFLCMVMLFRISTSFLVYIQLCYWSV